MTPILVKRDGPRGYKRINKKDYDPAKHEIYTPLAPPPVVPPPPAPPPAPPSPLDSLPADWKDQSGTDELKRIAAAVNDGRAVENRAQAVEVIEAALLKK